MPLLLFSLIIVAMVGVLGWISIVRIDEFHFGETLSARPFQLTGGALENTPIVSDVSLDDATPVKFVDQYPVVRASVDDRPLFAP